MVLEPHARDRAGFGEAERPHHGGGLGRRDHVGVVGVTDLVVADLERERHPRLAVVSDLDLEGAHDVRGRNAFRGGGLPRNDDPRESGPSYGEHVFQPRDVVVQGGCPGSVEVSREARGVFPEADFQGVPALRRPVGQHLPDDRGCEQPFDAARLVSRARAEPVDGNVEVASAVWPLGFLHGSSFIRSSYSPEVTSPSARARFAASARRSPITDPSHALMASATRWEGMPS